MSRVIATRLSIAACCVALVSSAAAQVPHLIADDLRGPAKILTHDDGTVFVVEAGRGPNQGRVTVFDRARRRATLIDQLPSGPNNGRTSGPSGLLQIGQRWYILIGAGDGIVPGPLPGNGGGQPGAIVTPVLNAPGGGVRSRRRGARDWIQPSAVGTCPDRGRRGGGAGQRSRAAVPSVAGRRLPRLPAGAAAGSRRGRACLESVWVGRDGGPHRRRRRIEKPDLARPA